MIAMAIIQSNTMEKVNKHMKVLVPQGYYDLEITSVDFGATQDKEGHRVIVDFKVVNNLKYNNVPKQVIYTIDNPKNPSAEDKFLRLFSELLTSAKITIEQRQGDFDTNLLIGRVVKAEIDLIEDGPKSETYDQIRRYY